MLSRYTAIVEHQDVLRVASDRQRLGSEADLSTIVAVAYRERSLWPSRTLAEGLVAVEDHGVPRLDRAQRPGIAARLFSRRVHERARDAQVIRLEVIAALDLHAREGQQGVAAVARRAEESFGEVLLEAAPVLLELRVVGGRERHDVGVRDERLAERDRLMRFHRADQALGDLHRLQLRAEEPRAPAFDEPARERLKPLHSSSRPPPSSRPPSSLLPPPRAR